MSLVDFVMVPGPPGHGQRRRHYVDHLAPVWHALPAEVRGQFAVCHKEMAEYARRQGIEPTVYRSGPTMMVALSAEKRLSVVPGHGDPQWLDHTGRPNVIMMHGVGFNFDDAKSLSCYPGTRQNRQNTMLMLSTNERIAQIERDANPHIRVEVVGCPKLDRWHLAPPKERSEPPVVAFAFHWLCRVCGESGTAWPHYRQALPSIAERYKVLGHGHPHIFDMLEREYKTMGIEPVRDLEEVFERADLMCFDATSAGYEFASIGRPVVVMNAPWYRRDVNFGLRFWGHADVGINVDGPGEWLDAIDEALAVSPWQEEKRRAAVAYAYEFTDGHCAERAAKAIMECL